MPRAATSEDVFNAIAEERRRAIVFELHDGRARAVGDLASKLGMRQPAVSKHLGVLRKVGIVTVTSEGRHRFYKLDARKLKPVHDWVGKFEQFWSSQIERIKSRAEKLAKESNDD